MKHEQHSPTVNPMIDEIASRMAEKAPWFTEPVVEAIRGISDTRKATRVREVLDNVMVRLEKFESKLSELYVKTPDFKRLLRRLMQLSGDEPREEKRRLYAAFLFISIISPLESAENQTRMLDILKQLNSDHVRLLQSLMNLPVQQTLYAKSPLQMLQTQIPDIPSDRMRGLLTQITQMGITTISDWSSGAYSDPEKVRKNFTAIGARLLRIINARRDSGKE